MAITVKVKAGNGDAEERDYPYIGKSRTTGQVVLFTRPCMGVRLVRPRAPASGDPGVYQHYREYNFDPLPKGTKIVLLNA